ncbi:hypothetical protein [Alteribacillus sp. YIM 98480]|uniref:hypothetical protein n=1 Tax=Alteribacillus sp. YIM 98480 TaxID=2606599 RepID=UPI00131D6275|nr:hypothetical protein [Alteribacillus sp. YIM 98480]
MSFTAKLISAFLSPFIFGAILGGAHFMIQPQSNSAVMFGVALVFSFPVYLILGIPTSFLIDRILANSNRYFNRFLLYAGVGVVAGSVLMFVFPDVMYSTHNGVLFSALLGAIASTIFLHVQFFLEIFSRKRSGTITSSK